MRRALGRYLLMRRAMPLLGVLAVLLALVVPAWAFWPRPAHEVLKSEPNRRPQAALRVTRFEIPHFPKLDAQHFDRRRVGTLGRTSFAAREDDEVTVRAELSGPAYSYLIAFRPDGTDELCDPDDESTPPPPRSNSRFTRPPRRATSGTG